MAFLPIPSITNTTQLISLAHSAVSVASATFADLLQGLTLTGKSENHGLPFSGSSANSLAELSRNPNSTLALKIETDTLLQDFHSSLLSELDSLGIDVSSGIELQLTSLGTIEVVGDRPDKLAIEIVLSGNSDYFETMQQIAVNSLLADKSHALDDADSFRIALDEEEITVHFGKPKSQ